MHSSLLSFLCLIGIQTAFAFGASVPVALKDYSGVATELFNNMRVPAALIAGAIVPIGFLSTPSIQPDDGGILKLQKRMHVLLALASLQSQVVAVTYSTIAINKLAEVTLLPTRGVGELLNQHYKLAWLGTNTHFLFGLFGFGLLVLSSVFIQKFGNEVGKIASCWTIANLLLCFSIVNRGISQGFGVEGGEMMKVGGNLVTLAWSYAKLLFARAQGGSPLPIASIGLVLYSLLLTYRLVSSPLGARKIVSKSAF